MHEKPVISGWTNIFGVKGQLVSHMALGMKAIEATSSSNPVIIACFLGQKERAHSRGNSPCQTQLSQPSQIHRRF